MRIRDRPTFFDRVGHETMYASSGNQHFSLNYVTVRPTKNSIQICLFFNRTEIIIAGIFRTRVISEI